MFYDDIVFRYDDVLADNLFYTQCFQDNNILGEVYVTFAKKPTEEDKFLYTYKMLKEYNKLPTITLKKPTDIKNNKISQKIRSLANVKFQNKKYVDSLWEYNASVRTAKNNSRDYALALANRSAALYHLEEYDDCINDIHRALASKYPNELAYKLYEREIKCLVKIKNISHATAKFKELMSHLNQSHLSKTKIKKIEMDIKMLLKESVGETNNVKKDEKIIIQFLGGLNKNIPSLSKFVKLKYSESMGRCLIVTTDVQPGDVLAIEESYTGVPRLESMEHNCRNCFKLCLNGIPCLTCTLVIYCDEICRSKSYESGHKYECQILTTIYNWPCMNHMEHLSLYIFLTSICKLGLDKYVSTVRALNADNTDPIMRGFNADGKYLSNQFCSVYTLEGNETKRTVNDLFLRYCYAAVIVSLLNQAGLKIPDEQLGIVGKSLVHIICVVASNAHGITQPSKRKTWNLCDKYEFLPVASLIMPVLSLLNHSCDPNVVRHNYNGTIVLRAIQSISKNSQLFDNYGKMYATHPKNIRQKMLNTQYFFQCECKACKEDWPVYSVLKNQPLSNGLMLVNENSQTFLNTQLHVLTNIITEMNERNCNGLKSIKFLYSFLAFLDNNIKKPWTEYCNCQETIKEVLYRTADNFIIENR